MASKKNEYEIIKIDKSKIGPAQMRLLKSLNSILHHVLTTNEESEFFEGSAECMRMCAALIKQAEFIEGFKDFEDIPYAEQVIEYSIDVLQEAIAEAKVIQYDC